MNMKNIIVLMKDSEFGDTLWNLSWDADTVDFDACWKIATMVMYLPWYEEFETLKKENSQLTKKYFDIACEILDYGDCGVIDDRFCDFLTKAFGITCTKIIPDKSFDIENGCEINV